MTRAFPGERRSRLPALLAAGACLGLAFLSWRLATMEIDISPVAPGGAGEAVRLAAIETLPAEPKPPAPGAFPQTLARPLFRANRRPPQPGAAGRQNTPGQQRAARPPDSLELVGVMKDTGGAERALIRTPASPTGEWLEVGHVLDGWRLSRIEPGGVTFESDGQKLSLSLFPKKDEARKNE